MCGVSDLDKTSEDEDTLRILEVAFSDLLDSNRDIKDSFEINVIDQSQIELILIGSQLQDLFTKILTANEIASDLELIPSPYCITFYNKDIEENISIENSRLQASIIYQIKG